MLSGRNHAGLARFFECEPDLLVHVPEAERVIARDRVIVEVARVELPEVVPLPDCPHLVLDGLLIRQVACFGHNGTELLGPGDVLSPSDLKGDAKWAGRQQVLLGRLDARLQRDLSRWPGVMGAVIDRLSDRSQTLAARLAIAQIRSLETRLLALLWLMADRWGRVGPTGVTLQLPGSQAVLAELACARRPSVNVALRRLRERGAITPRADGRVTLHAEPPESAHVARTPVCGSASDVRRTVGVAAA